MTPDRVFSDPLFVADAAGFDRFAWCGHFWGAIHGLMLASRSDRVSALVCGTWPPLGVPYAEMPESAGAGRFTRLVPADSDRPWGAVHSRLGEDGSATGTPCVSGR